MEPADTLYRKPFMDITLIIELLMLGLMAGFMAGLLGIGGGMVLVPFLTYLFSQRGIEDGLSVKMAIATAMATIMLTSISSMRAHHKRQGVHWSIVKLMAPGVFLGALLASVGVFSLIKGQALAAFFAAFVGYSAWKMWQSSTAAGKSKPMPGAFGMASAGTGIGFLSGLVGAGGGFMTVPFLTHRGIPMHQAVGTSAAMGFPIAVFNTLGFVFSGWAVQGLPAGALGYVHTYAWLTLASASVLMAPWGAKAAHSLPVKPLKRIFALVLVCLAVYMLGKAAGWV